jgi:hypothetical protein
MKFEHTQARDDGAGTITVTAETSKEVIELADHFRMYDKDEPEQLIALAEAIKAGTLTYTSKPNAKRPWFRCESALDYEFTQPYEDLLRKITGFDGGTLPDMDLTPFHARRLCHTHITAEARFKNGHYCYVVFIQAEDWNGKTAAERADINAEDYTQEDLGHRQHEREYIETRGGHMVRNPNYLKRHRARPALGCTWLWAALFNWWRMNKASAAQRAALDQCDETHKAYRLEPSYLIRSSGGPGYLVQSQHLVTSYADPVQLVTWENFAKL